MAAHASMLQVSTPHGEASTTNMEPLVNALTDGTNWEGGLLARNVMNRKNNDFPEAMYPEKAIDNEDRQAEWLSVKNINV